MSGADALNSDPQIMHFLINLAVIRLSLQIVIPGIMIVFKRQKGKHQHHSLPSHLPARMLTHCVGWVAGLRFRHVAAPAGTWTEGTAEPEAPGDPRAWGMIQAAYVVTGATLLQPPDIPAPPRHTPALAGRLFQVRWMRG